MAEETQNQNKSTAKKTTQNQNKSILYWVKVPSYVYDAVLDLKKEDRKGHVIGEAVVWEPGLYQVNGEVKRFEKSSNRYVERFDGTIPEVRLHEIAKTYMVDTEDGKGNLRDTKDILADIVQERELPAKEN